MTTKDDAVKAMKRKSVAEAIDKGYMVDVEVPVLLIEADPSKGEFFPTGDFGYIEIPDRKTKLGKYAMIVPVYQRNYWEGLQGRRTHTKNYMFNITERMVKLHLTDSEAAVITGATNQLHEVLMGLKKPVVVFNERTKQDEIKRSGLMHPGVVTLIPVEDELEVVQCAGITAAGTQCKNTGVEEVDGEMYCRYHAQKAQVEE